MAENTLPIALASDHVGVSLKALLCKKLIADGYQVIDLGPETTEAVDYPDFGHKLADEIASGRAARGILVCGTGIGISIAANRNPAVRAAVCTSGQLARLARQHNDANVLALGARIVGEEVALDCVDEFLNTEFEGGRHALRVAKI